MGIRLIKTAYLIERGGACGIKVMGHTRTHPLQGNVPYNIKYTILLLPEYCQPIREELYSKGKNNIEMKRRRLLSH